MIRALMASILLVCLAPLNLVAQETEKYQAGTHYIVLEQPVRTTTPDKINIDEVFWYGCHHCFTFEPMVQAWKKQLPEDVAFTQTPAMWDRGGVMRKHAKAYYAAKALDVLDTVHQPIFNALNIEGKKLVSDDEIAQLFVDYGVDKQQFMKAFNSFGVNSQVRQADARARSYGIRGTPEVIVNGKYRVTARMAGGQAEMLEVADFLIAKERATAIPAQ